MKMDGELALCRCRRRLINGPVISGCAAARVIHYGGPGAVREVVGAGKH